MPNIVLFDLMNFIGSTAFYSRDQSITQKGALHILTRSLIVPFICMQFKAHIPTE